MTVEVPKVLVVSHNAFSRVLNNGKTLTSIFAGWPADKIAQLYFQSETPDTTICTRFFCITDQSMLLGRKNDVGQVVEIGPDGPIEDIRSRMPAFIRHHRTSLFATARNIVWASRKWDNQRLRSWLDDFKPELIFFVGGASPFAYDIVNMIAGEYHIPVYLYYTDDYLTPMPTIDVFWWINWFWLRRALRRMLDKVEKLFVIGEDMAKEYAQLFGKSCVPIMNAVNTQDYRLSETGGGRISSPDRVLRLAYFGGLHLNRWKTLTALGRAIEAYSTNTGAEMRLDIFSSTSPQEGVLRKLHRPPYSRFMGSVGPDDLIETMNKYDVLVHVESFGLRERYKTRLSISTKIPEYLASGKIILAIGPPEVASIKYLDTNRVGYVVTSNKGPVLERALRDLDAGRNKFGLLRERAIALAQKNHELRYNMALVRRHLRVRSAKSESTL